MHRLLSGLPFNGLVAGLAAAEAGSFSAAADELGLTHGSISRRIGHLELWLGVPIFERGARGVSLTPAGQRFIATAKGALAALTENAEQWRPSRGRVVVRISVVPSFARLWLIPRLRDLQGDDLTLELIVEHRPSDIEAREADLAIRYGAGRYADVDVRCLFRERLAPCASPDVAATLGPTPTALEIAGLPLLHDSNPTQWQAWLSAEGVAYRPRVQDRRFEDYDLVLQAAAAGLGVALLREPTASSWLDKGLLSRVATRMIANASAHYLVSRKGENRERVREVVRRLVDAATATDGPSG